MAHPIHGNLEIKNGNLLVEGNELIHSDVITSLSQFGVEGSATWFNYDGSVVHILHNAGTGATSSSARFLVGDFTNPVNEKYGQLSYFLPGYISNQGGVRYQNKLVLKSNNGSDGLVMTSETGTMSFMQNANSDPKMVLTKTGRLGINSLTPDEILEVGGNIKLSEGANRQIFAGDVTNSDGVDLTVKAGNTAFFNGVGGNVFMNAGDATVGGSASGGEVFISGGNNGVGGFDAVNIGGNQTNIGTNYTLYVTSNSSGTGVLGIRTSNPEAVLHIKKNSITTPTISGNTVLLIENSTSFSMEAGISMLCGIGGRNNIYFGDSSQERIMFMESSSSGLELGSYQSGTSIFVDNSANPYVTIGTASTPSATLHVVESGGTIPTIASGTIAIFQNNLASRTDAFISIVGGVEGSSGINFGNSSDENVGIIDYNNVNNEFQFTTNGIADNGPNINSSGTLITKGRSVATVFYDVLGPITENPNVATEFIVARAQGGRLVANLTIVLPDNTDGIVDGHVIDVRTLAISTGSITLQASSGTPNGFFRLDGTTPVTYALSANTSYRFIYELSLNRWVEL